MVICNIICIIGAVLVDRKAYFISVMNIVADKTPELPHTKANLRLGAFYGSYPYFRILQYLGLIT